MQWKNPDGSLTEGVVVEDGAGNKLGTSANPLMVTSAPAARLRPPRALSSQERSPMARA